MLVNSKKLLEKLSPNRALCAFNFSTPEVAGAIIKTAASSHAPFILQTSQGEASFLNPQIAQTIAQYSSEKYQIHFSLSLDHGKDFPFIKKCLSAGYTSIHFDGSNLSLPENISRAKEVVNLCHPKNISVEGELGIIGGSSSLENNVIEGSFTDTDQVLEFVQKTGIDFLAVSIGSKHGLGKADLQFNLLNKISQSIKVPLVLHGGSGIAESDLKKAIALGIRKVNFNTELRLAWAKALKKFLNQNPREIIPYKILPAAQEAVAKVVEEKLRICTL